MDHALFLSRPGFVYRIGTNYYYIGKWICQKCDNTDAADSHFMYEMALKEQDLSDLNLYYQRLRAYSDFALVPPFNAAAVQESQDHLLASLSDSQKEDLQKQMEDFQFCFSKFNNSPS